MKIFYHSRDLDGTASAAIILQYRSDLDPCPIDYGDPFPWDKISCDERERIYMVDFSLPRSEMERLNTIAELTWIDHHKTAIAEMEGLNIPGLRRTDSAACELCWEWCHPDIEVPRSIRLLGRYDIWDHSGEYADWETEIYPFQLGARIQWPLPTPPDYRDMVTERKVPSLISDGIAIDKYLASGRKTIEAVMFSGDLSICNSINIPHPKILEEILAESPGGMAAFYFRRGDGRWQVSLRADTQRADASIYAKAHGGGGHPGAAGFICHEMPFKK
ncbi:MAG: hypothetical protein ABIH03_08010 [Pseudomonadota bacterium]